MLRREDQRTIAALAALGLLLTCGYWLAAGGSGGLEDIDRQAHRDVRLNVDINTADWPELALLPKVGETLARRIVESREVDGPFSSPEDLRRVPGIGPKTLDSIRPYLQGFDGASQSGESP